MNNSQKSVRLAGRELRNDGPVFLVAETGTTCNGKLDTALALVDAIADAGMDAIKFQMINPEAFMSDRSVAYDYDWGKGQRKKENMFEMFQSLRFSDEQWGRIGQRCKERNLPFFATIDYLDGVQLAVSLEMVALKVGSWDIRHTALLRTIAAAGKPIILDLGPAQLSEIDRALQIIAEEKNEQVILLHCTHSTTDEEVNLRTIPYLANTFGFPVGYSADTRDMVPDLVAVGLGACMMEKRVTLNHQFAAHHHNKALEPAELKDWVASIRRGEKQRGGYFVKPSREDLRLRDPYFVSITAAREIAPGERIAPKDLVFKRPGTGLHPDLTETIVGRTARCRIAVDQQLTWEMV